MTEESKVRAALLSPWSRRGVLQLTAVLLLEIGALWLGGTSWIGSWSDTSIMIEQQVLFVGPLCAALAAYSSGSVVSAVLQHGTGKPPAWLNVSVLFGSVGWNVAGYFGAALIAVAVTTANGAGPPVISGFVAFGALWLVVCVAVGHLFGAAIRLRWLAVTVAALAAFLALALTFDSGTPVLTHTAGPWLAVRVDALCRVLTLGTCLGTLAVAVGTGSVSTRQLRQTGPRVLVSAGVAGVASVAAAVWLMSGNGLGVRRQPPPEPACAVAPDIEFCVWPDHKKYLPQLENLAANSRRVPDAFKQPSRLVEEGIDGGEGTGFVLPDGGLWMLTAIHANQTLRNTFGVTACDIPEDDWENLDRAWWELDVWIQLTLTQAEWPTDLGGGANVNYTEIEAVTFGPPEASEEWAAERADLIRQIASSGCG
ncbi:MAG: hypothetical protein LBU05_05050 [Bifidobacteriaceae bacterium]|jgi:hypothetical protein|nr:hypothetical protein [Bifidobacteriaceae bacterium]